MKKLQISIILSTVFFLLINLTLCFAYEKRKPVLIEGKSFLPLRILTRPFSNIYTEKSITSGIAIENVPTFQPFYVYTCPTEEEKNTESGWYEVGSDNRGTIIGWMKEQDVFEWKQTMCLFYTHPEGRYPVLFFDDYENINGLIKSEKEVRKSRTLDYLNKIESKTIPSDFPIISLEPKKYVDFSEEFYLLPILDFKGISIDQREGRLLKLAAATSSGSDSREVSDIRFSKEYL